MRYAHPLPGRFLDRPNRFIAHVETDAGVRTVHVKNTGRCRELLLPGARVILNRAEGNSVRKTEYDLTAVYKGEMLVNIDSQAPNAAAAELLARLLPGAVLRPERVYGASRFDFGVERGASRGFVEVKGVTLEQNGLALFPDAPTERGTKHVRELIRARREGYDAALLLLIQMKGPRAFSPNDGTDPAFGAALREARRAGVTLLCYDCRVTEAGMTADAPVELVL